MTRPSTRKLIALACGLAAANSQGCGGKSQGTNGASGGDGGGAGVVAAGGLAGAGGGGGAAGADPLCTEEVGECPATTLESPKVLLDAADFGVSARLVALGGPTVLVEVGDSSFQVVRVLDADEQETTGATRAVWSVPSGAGTPRAVTEAMLFDDDRLGLRTVVALACDEPGESCRLLRGDERSEELSPWAGSELPSELEAHRLVVDAATDPPVVCAYGNGLFCLRDGWQPEIPVTEGLRLNHVTVSSYWSLAVGEEGRWFKRAFDDDFVLSAWTEQPPLGTASLTHASTAGRGGVILGEGRIQAALGEQAAMYGCEVPRELAALLLNEAVAGVATAMTASGELLLHTDLQTGQPRYCSHAQLPAGSLTAFDAAPCRDSLNPRVVVDATQLLGNNLCVRVIR